jgi:hypothetical protein
MFCAGNTGNSINVTTRAALVLFSKKNSDTLIRFFARKVSDNFRIDSCRTPVAGL